MKTFSNAFSYTIGNATCQALLHQGGGGVLNAKKIKYITLYFKPRGFHGNQKGNPKECGIPTKIRIAHQHLILGYKTWCQINAMS